MLEDTLIGMLIFAGSVYSANQLVNLYTGIHFAIKDYQREKMWAADRIASAAEKAEVAETKKNKKVAV